MKKKKEIRDTSVYIEYEKWPPITYNIMNAKIQRNSNFLTYKVIFESMLFISFKFIILCLS